MKLEQVASLVSGTLEGEGSIEIKGVRGVHDAVLPKNNSLPF